MKRASLKILSGLLGLLISANICFADNVSAAIESYKAGKYDACIETMKDVVRKDPTSAIGYYYLGLAYSKTGKSFLAVQNYDKVIALNSDSTLTTLAKQGRAKSGGKNVVSIENQIEDIEDEYNPIYNDAAVGTQSNATGTTQGNAPQTTKTVKATAATKPAQQKTAQSNPNGTPSNEEILNAINVLRKAGLLNNGGAALTGAANAQAPNNVPVDSRTQQMQALMMMMNNNNGYGGNNNMNMMQMMPYLNNGGKVDPKLMQMMLMNQMMPNFSTGNENNGY